LTKAFEVVRRLSPRDLDEIALAIFQLAWMATMRATFSTMRAVACGRSDIACLQCSPGKTCSERAHGASTGRPHAGWTSIGTRCCRRCWFHMAEPDIKAQIVGEIYIALQRLDADEELLSIIGSWRDTLGDATVLELLRDYNAGRMTLHRPE
jgi:hypothetical protein